MSGIAYRNWKFTGPAYITVPWHRNRDVNYSGKKEPQVKNFLNSAARILMAAANSRAMNVVRKQAELIKPSKVEYRSNAGGWN
jgi:hypothetical protein